VIGNTVGIGASSGGSCGSVTILNGSVSAQGGWDKPGIGTGSANCDAASTVTNLTIMSGNITASSSDRGSGIGSGYSEVQILELDLASSVVLRQLQILRL
jgi:hypothetical protein